MKWYKTPSVSVVWAVLRVWLGIQWITGGWEKISGGGFDASGFLKGAIAGTAGAHPAVQGWYGDFLQSFALPNVEIFNVLVPWGELLVGIGLIIGALTIPALIAGIVMNLSFMLAGTTSTNPILYTVAVVLLFTGTGSYYWGVDRFAIPFFKERFGKDKKMGTHTHTTT